MAVPGSKISWQKISQQSPFKLACLACFQGLWGGSKDLGSTNKKKRFSAKNIKKSTHCIIMRNSNILKWGNNNKNNKLSLGLGSKNNTPDKSKIFPILHYILYFSLLRYISSRLTWYENFHGTLVHIRYKYILTYLNP